MHKLSKSQVPPLYYILHRFVRKVETAIMKMFSPLNVKPPDNDLTQICADRYVA